MNFEQKVLDVIYETISTQIGSALSGYNSPLRKVVDGVVNKHYEKLQNDFESALLGVIDKKGFEKELRDCFQHVLAKQFVSSFTSTTDKAISTIKNNQVLKAKMIVAIENIIKEYNAPNEPAQ